MDVNTPHRQSAFSRVKQEHSDSELTELKPVPTTLPGAGIQNHIPMPVLYSPEMLLHMFQPFQNGYYPPPEPFGRPQAVNLPTTSNETISVAKDPALQQIRQQHDDRDSGNESTTMSPVSCFSSRSPSTSSRSNSFSMSTLLKANDRPPSAATLDNISQSQNSTATVSNPPGRAIGLGSSLPPLMAKPQPTNPSQLPPLFQSSNLHKPNLPSFPGIPQLGQNPIGLNAQLLGQIHQYEHFRRLAQNPPFDPLMSGPFREMCDICGDNASGYHYGVMSCEGCKGFFRRTVQKGCDYKCHRDNSCKVDRVNRNRCQACRYQRCLEKGMAKESVRQDRGKRSKKNDEETRQQLEDLKEVMVNIDEIISSFKTAFPSQAKIQSLQDLEMRITLFVSNLRLFSVIEKTQLEMLVRKANRGVALLRAALSEDECLSILPERDLVIKIKAGIEIASYEDLAVLTAVYIASFGENVELTDQLSRCLRSQLKRRINNEEHLFTALMSKLALLS